MSGTRWLIIAAVLATLAALLAWQMARHNDIARCQEDGGLWDGANSRCAPKPSGPILQRDIYRS